MRTIVVLLCLVILISCISEKNTLFVDTDESSINGNDPIYDVIIVGGGIAGLSAAYELHDDYDILVLEKESFVGGRALAGDHQGYAYAKGAEYTGSPEGKFKEMLEELNVKPIEIPFPADAVYYNDSFHIGYQNVTSLYLTHRCPCDGLSVGQYNRFLRTIVDVANNFDGETLTPEQQRLDSLSVQEFFDELDVDEFYYVKFNTAIKGLFGTNIQEMSALASLWEIAYEFEGEEEIEDASDFKEEQGSTGVYTFIGGLTEVVIALGEELGDSIQTDAKVIAIEQDEDNFIVTYEDTTGQRTTLSADVVIVATPAPVTVKIAKSVLTLYQKELLSSIEYAPYITVTLFSDEPIFNQAFDLAVYDAIFTDVYDATWVQGHTDTTLPSVGITSLYIAAESYKDRSILALSDKELLERVYIDLDKIFPGSSSTVTGYDIQRFWYAYPVIPPGGYGKILELRSVNHGSILLAGDYMTYPTFEEAARSGFLAAEQAMKELEK